MSSLYKDICKWLDFLVFSDKDDKPLTLTPSHISLFILLVLEKLELVEWERTHTLFEKSRWRSSRCGGLAMGILTELRIAKIWTMAPPNLSDIKPKRTKKVGLVINIVVLV